MQKTKEELLHILAEHTGQLYEKILADADRDYWMNAQEAVEYGMVDTIMTKKKK
jgi:ATP-dependent Clp protease protease subunit